MEKIKLKKTISGMQSGVDLAAVALAKKYGLLVGGMMPKGYKTLDGNKPEYKDLYNAIESTSFNYPPRTYDNVKNSDGTLRFYTKKDSSGEICTLKAINQYKKPYFDVDFNNPCEKEDVVNWIVDNNIEVLNVAGNSEKTSPRIGVKVLYYLNDVFKLLGLTINDNN